MGREYFSPLIFMKDYLIKFDGIFDLYNRFKKIDKNYELFYNRKTNRFELYSGVMRKNLELIFGELNSSKCLIKTQQSRMQNIERVIKEIELYNERLQQKTIDNLRDKTMLVAEEAINYADKTSKDITLQEINSIMENTNA